jgi:membrane peptidoglycan carboxypeptidase
MQYVRQALAYSARTNEEIVAATEQTPARKLREMKFALAIEKKYNKQQILERYLNISSFGHGAYGIYAASQVYFGKDSKNLTLGEATLLAGLVKAPSAFDPADPENPQKRADALDRREYVLRQMVALKFVTPQQADEARAVELKILGQRSPEGCASMPREDLGAGFFCDYLYRWWLEQRDFGVSSHERENKLRSGGYRIITSLDLNTQAAMKKNIEAQLPIGSPYALMQAGVEPGTGKVLAMATNRIFSNDNTGNGLSTEPSKRSRGVKGNYPKTTNPLMTGGGTIDGYQAGSTFKMFTMVAALERGLPLDYTINSPKVFKSNYRIERGSPAACPGTFFYCPSNASDSMAGVKNMWTGFGQSVNTYFVPLQQTVGAENAVDVAKRLGIQFRAKGAGGNPGDYEFANNKVAANQWGAFTLGVSQTTPLDLANAYATLANDGLYCAPTPVTEILDINGNKLTTGKPQCHKAVEPNVARAAVDAARCSVGDQSAFGRCGGSTAQVVKNTVNRPVAGKTGTTDGNRNAALVAMTKQLAIGAIEADPDWAQNPAEMSHDRVNKSVANTLRDASNGKPAVNFTAPGRDIAFGKRTGIPAVACKSVDEAQGTLRNVGLEVTVDPDPITSNCPPGSVAKTEPSGETSRNGIVTLFLSRGGGNATPGRNQGGGTGQDPGTNPPRTPGPLCERFPALCRPRP